MKGLIIGIWLITTLVSSGNNSATANISEDTYAKKYDDYQMFYGTWQITEVVSQHRRIGGDKGFESLIGEYVTYTYDYYECCGNVIDNPDYWITVRPIEEDAYNEFFPEQIGIEELLPGAGFCTFISIVDKPRLEDLQVCRATDFFIKDDNIMYCFDYNCIYKMIRVEYPENYDEKIDVTELEPKW